MGLANKSRIEVELIKDHDTHTQEIEDFIQTSVNGTIFHMPRFLKYHSPDKFPPAKLNICHFIFRCKNKIVAFIPGGIKKEGEMLEYLSPYGASHGGFVLNKDIYFSESVEVVDVFHRELSALSINSSRIRLPPPFYYKYGNDSRIEFLLRRIGYEYELQELTYAIDLNAKSGISFKDNARHAITQAERYGLEVKMSKDYELFYQLLQQTFKRFEVHPTHTLAELIEIDRLLPQTLKLFIAFYDGRPIGAVLVFVCSLTTAYTFYICHDQDFSKYRPVNFLIYEILKWAKDNNFDHLDLGTVSIGYELNQGLTFFKETLGAKNYLRNRLIYKWVK